MRRLAGDVKPEIEILLCYARRALQPIHIQRLKQILEGQIDWPLLFELAEENSLTPLLCEHLLHSSLNLPSDVETKCREDNRKVGLRSLILTAELLRIMDCLQRRNIPALPYKGPVLGQLAYGNPLLRQFDDLDLVVPQRFIPQVYDAMDELGYKAKFPRERMAAAGGKNIPGEYVFRHGALVEWHTEQTLRHFPHSPHLEAMLHRSVPLLLTGHEVRTFGSADTVLLLCVHGAKDFWSRLIWIADVAAILESFSSQDWEQLFAEARKCGAERMVRLGLWLANGLFDSELPTRILKEVEEDHAVQHLGKELLDALLDRKAFPHGIVWRSSYRMRMVAPVWEGFRYWVRLSTAPAEEDWDEGQPIHVSYALSRPFRLWRKYRNPRKTEK